ncbi:MAG: tRNA pseudouridine(55) synthase TruB [Vicinamibacterales bacterium]
MNGVLVVDKPEGPTSHDVVARVRRALHTRRVGHTGTLDPLATGVLPLVLGSVTRLAQFLASDDKAYLADVRFGFSTTTYDAQGSPTGGTAPEGGPFTVEPGAVGRELEHFRGTYLQMPPAFSAKKVAGRPAYELARAGQVAELTAVEVTVQELEIVEQHGATTRLRIVCTSGFYVRTLAHELGVRLGCGAHLSALRRTRAGTFELKDAVPLAEIEAAGVDIGARLLPPERLLTDIPAALLTATGTSRARHGAAIGPAEWQGDRSVTGGRMRLLDDAGGLLGIGEIRPGGLLHPVLVLV